MADELVVDGLDDGKDMTNLLTVQIFEFILFSKKSFFIFKLKIEFIKIGLINEAKKMVLLMLLACYRIMHKFCFFFQKIEKKNIIKMIRIFYVDLKKALLKDLILMENICQSWRLIRKIFGG